MSADNYNSIDYDPERAPSAKRPWSVTMGFDSDDETPTPDRNSRWFDDVTAAILCGEDDWTEYGTRMTARAISQTKKEARERERASHR